MGGHLIAQKSGMCPMIGGIRVRLTRQTVSLQAKPCHFSWRSLLLLSQSLQETGAMLAWWWAGSLSFVRFRLDELDSRLEPASISHGPLQFSLAASSSLHSQASNARCSAPVAPNSSSFDLSTLALTFYSEFDEAASFLPLKAPCPRPLSSTEECRWWVVKKRERNPTISQL